MMQIRRLGSKPVIEIRIQSEIAILIHNATENEIFQVMAEIYHLHQFLMHLFIFQF